MTEPIKCANCGETPTRPCAYCGCGLVRCFDSGWGGACCPDCDHHVQNVFDRPPLPTSREWLDDDRDVEGAPYCGADLGGYRCTRSHSDSRHVAGAGKIVAGRWYDDGPFVEAE